MANPFLDDIATDPRRDTPSVNGLNDHALDELLRVFDAMTGGRLPRLRHDPVKAQLVLSVEPGYGKSHLINRLFEKLRGRATLVYLRPFMAVETCWRSLLDRMVQELNYPDRSGTQGAHTQLDAFACGVLSHLVASLIEKGTLTATDAGASVAYLRKNPLDAFSLMQTEPAWTDWLRIVIPQCYEAMAVELVSAGLAPRRCLSWLRVLFTIVLNRDNSDVRNACMDWIAAVPIDEEMRAIIGLRPGDVVTQEDDSDLCRHRLSALGSLAAYYRPFVLCFDQTDAYADNPALAKQFSNVTEFLLAEMPHQMTVVTANRAPWDQGILPHFQNAQIDRFRDTPISLEGINQRQARALIHMRLDAAEAAGQINASRLDEGWLSQMFQGRGEMAVRNLLRVASRRWDDETAMPDETGQSLQERFQASVQKHLQSPDLCRFNAETLWWFVREAADGQCGLNTSAHNDHSYFTVRWQWETKVRLIGFEGGSNAMRWGAIADRSRDFHNKNLGIRTIVLRTPELPAIPARTWAAVRQKIDAAHGVFLDICVLDTQETAQVYAARVLVEESVADDIPFSKKETLDFVRGKLRPILERLKTPGEIETASVSVQSPGQKKNDLVASAPLTSGSGNELSSDIAAVIEKTYRSFGLGVRVVDCLETAQLLRYRLKPDEGVKVISVAARAKDLQVALGLENAPMIEPVPGFIAVDIPRNQPLTVLWSRIIRCEEMLRVTSPVAFPVGVGLNGNPIVADLANPTTCHMLVGGAAGSGKSEFLKSFVASLVSRNQPGTLTLSIVDPKILTFGGVVHSPYLANPVLTSLDEALILLRNVAGEMDSRYAQLAAEGLVNLKQRFDLGRRDIPFHVIVFDEFADLIMSGKTEKKEFETLVARIAARGRAAGVHLILATQRPDRNIVTGLISANLGLKVCLRVNKDTNSRIILGESGGQCLVGRGDLLCDLGKGIVRCQSPLLSQEEFFALMEHREPSTSVTTPPPARIPGRGVLLPVR